ncbi:PAS-domain containing protein [Sulfitobacter sp. S190]|uniref:PAS-domain containing protein n=1 Tax=Sulfitobacter sp. S190 TaxID=2867022 RepID=UPI0021A6B420|nr:PAS-domain containing protein [Sulfitobacter sp. S190]UWR22450.1 PAS-domain containing protein [Sulfitobacter sp. S190]
MALLEIAVTVLCVVLSVALAVWWVTRPVEVTETVDPEDPTVLLFRGGVLHHASAAALSKLPLAIGTHDWEDLRDLLLPRFPSFPALPDVDSTGDMRLSSLGGGPDNQITLEWSDGHIRAHFGEGFSLHPSENTADTDELNTLRQINAQSRDPACKTDMAGNVVWRNTAFDQLIKNLGYPAQQARTNPFVTAKEVTAANGSKRVSLKLPGRSDPIFFDLTVRNTTDGMLYYATCLEEVVKAERAQQNFVQSLAKTFVHLSIGLAVFDRKGQLVVFNPAMVDLTGLSAEFLVTRPTLMSFFDTLRENRRMPEPKNYTAWRSDITALIGAPDHAHYQDTWTLENGQTYRVIGRPHADGTTAFLIEDISAEIALTRTYRAELEIGQSLLDSFEDGLVVFSQSGMMTFSNAAYESLWQHNHDTSFADVSIADAIGIWKRGSAPNPLWHDIEDTVLSFGERTAWDMPVQLSDGRALACRVVPIASGATMVRFAPAAEQAEPHKIAGLASKS